MSALAVLAVATGLIVQDSNCFHVYAQGSGQLELTLTGGVASPPIPAGDEWRTLVHPLAMGVPVLVEVAGGVRIEAFRPLGDCRNCEDPTLPVWNTCGWLCPDPYVVTWAGPADVDCDGDAGTDFDIIAFFQCLAGSCCEHCAADFDGDGDERTDADVLTFFRVLAGG